MKLLTAKRLGLTLLAAAALLAGCTEPAPKVVAKYPTLPVRQVPPFLADTIYQYTDMSGVDPYPVSGFGLVANLNGTGGSHAPTAVRDFIVKEMSRNSMGVTGDVDNTDPEQLLNNKSFAIVRVDGFIPPGARAGIDWCTWFDVRVTALPGSETTSLAHGDLYTCDLKVDGANPLDPNGEFVEVMAQARGAIFVNPAHIFDTSDSPTSRASRRSGVVIGGARVLSDHPLILHLRQPQRRLARAIEHRIIEQFQDVVDDDLRSKHVADAQDEGVIYVYVPRFYSSDWNHFAGIVKHLYLRGDEPDFAAIQSQKLADAAVEPDAPLADISYAWEGLGKPALHAIEPLMSGDKPDVQYAAVRAAAFLGDPAAVTALVDIAQNASNPFRVPAVQVLGQLPPSPLVASQLRKLLDSDQALVRIEAYKVLTRSDEAEQTDASPIYTHIVKAGDDEKFVLDVVRCGGPPLVYASRQTVPRLAIFGTQTTLNLPIMFLTMGDRFSISSDPTDKSVTIFYRGQELSKPIKMTSSPELAEIAARLGGDGPAGLPHLDFSYSDVVAIVQSMADARQISGVDEGRRQPAAFVLQEPSVVQEQIDTAPLLRDEGRPQKDVPAAQSSASP